MYNLHSHTYRCHHAKGTDEEYVLSAIKNGYTEMGFSDHAPYIFPNGHKSNFRMDCDEAQGYANSVRELQEKYKGVIDIKLGFETEYYPELIEKELEFLKSFKYDYIILGQHFTDNEYEPYARYSGHETDSVAILNKYISQVLLAAKSGEFTYIAHPDVINFTGDKEIYLKKMRRMVTELKKIGIPLEFNFLGFTTNRHYPNRDFWQIVSEVGNDTVIGLDAHRIEAYADKENLKKANEYLFSLGITPLKRVNLINYKKEITTIGDGNE